MYLQKGGIVLSLKIRLNRLQQKLKENGLDAIMITNSINRSYISGFYGTAGYVIVMQNKAFLLTDFRYTQQAANQAQYFEVIQLEGNPFEKINLLIKDYDVKTLGFEDKDITYYQYAQFKEKINADQLIPVKDLILNLRKIKDETEIEKMREAAKIADMAFSHILKMIKPGITEIEIALELEFFMKKKGAKSLSFDTIVVSGVRSSLPHGQPTHKTIEVGDLVTMDFGCVVDGYCSDMTRTIGIGSLNQKQKEIYHIVLEAQTKALALLRHGKTGKEIDKIARDIITSYGYKNYFGHGLGHGVGCEIHEDPRLSPVGEESLKPGMVVTVEPGIYIKGFGGVRIEDMVVITDDGVDNFVSSTKELLII